MPLTPDEIKANQIAYNQKEVKLFLESIDKALQSHSWDYAQSMDYHVPKNTRPSVVAELKQVYTECGWIVELETRSLTSYRFTFKMPVEITLTRLTS